MIALRSAMHRVSLNTAWLLASRVISQALSAITLIILARTLGASGLGQYAFATSIIFVANALTTYGTDTLIIREVARDASSAPRWLIASLIIQLTLSLITIAIIWIISDAPALHLYSLALIPLSFSTVYSAILRAFERMDAYMLFTIVVAAAQTLGILLIATPHADLTRIMLVLIASQIIGAALAAFITHNSSVISFSSSLKAQSSSLIRPILIAGLPLVILMVLSLLYQRLAIFTLSLFTDDASIGQYSAALRLIEACKLFPAASLGALFPILSRRDIQSLWRIESADFRLIAYALITALILYLISPLIIPTLFGADYAPAIPILRTLGWSLIPYVIAASISLRLVAAKRERTVLITMYLTLPISAAVFALLISYNGLHGAALATLLSESLQAAILMILAWRS